MRRFLRELRKTPKPEQSPSVTPSSSKTFASGIKLLYDSENSVVDIVFVHGLTGDREKTWTAHGASEPWPKTLLPSELPNSRILTFGYDAYVVDWRGMVSQNRISNHGWNLLTSLSSYREKDNTALARSRERPDLHLQRIATSTRGIAFLGTPHHGAGLAQWAELLSRILGLIKATNTEIVAVLRRESEILSRIQESFHAMVIARNREGMQPIEISCFYEELPLPGIGQVVPQHSAVLPGHIVIGIHSNHMDMARFAAKDDQGFTAVCGELRRWVKQISVAEGHYGDSPTIGYNEGPPRGLQDKSRSPTQFLVPYTTNPDFVGRFGILDLLKDQLGYGPSQADGRSQCRATLYGLGGVGKTQIALAYAYWLTESFPEVSVFWVHASSAERFRQAYSSIAQECGVPGYEPKADVLSLVQTWLQSNDHGRWLMVIDNADDLQLFSQPENLGKWIPECAHGSILITTRNKMVGSRLTRSKCLIKVGNMDEGESRLLLREKLEADNLDPDDLSLLSSRLEHLPLALIQAAAFIQEMSISVDSYLQLLDKSDQHVVDLLSEEFETVGRDAEASRTVAETWILSFEQIQQQDAFAGELLSLMSLFDRRAIPQKFIHDYSERQRGQELRGEIRVTKALGILKAFSFLTEDKDHGFDIHRLIQLVTRNWLDRKGTIRQFERQAILTVSRNYPSGNHENRQTCGAFLAHVDVVLKFEGTGLKDERLARASLLHSTAGFFNYQGRWKDAEEYFMQAINIQKEVLGDEWPDTLTSMGNLALMYWNQGRWKEAEILEVQVMELRRRILGDEHLDTLTSKNSLALIYWNQGQWKEAEVLGAQVVEIRKKLLGDEHPDTLISMSNLASTYWSQGRWKEAEALDVQLMESKEEGFGR
ncbi:Kinesin light chain [Madurella mycetomatis]|uniref:Kinesin light chain n=1 Tax=Madurella mycetomatis TaxID=100816 RepID=A0A175VVM4_9PEZI|nr:Kinesin light chain [Madurella mycetomatis]